MPRHLFCLLASVALAVTALLPAALAQPTPIQGALTAGEHRAALDVSRLAPGVYVVRAAANTSTGAVVETARLTVTR